MSDGEFQRPDYYNTHIPWSQQLEDFFRKQAEESKKTIEKYGLPEELTKYGYQIKMTPEEIKSLTELKKEKMTGVDLISKERWEHKIKHGKSVKHDFETYKNKELVQAALGLMLGNPLFMPEGWDEEQYGKMLGKPEVERLIIAGSLIAAQIDVLNFEDND
jgi:hypothetical protein